MSDYSSDTNKYKFYLQLFYKTKINKLLTFKIK